MSGFTSVDESADPARLVALLDRFAEAEVGMKHYALAAHALRRPTRPILDLGCGAGHDLALFASAGLDVVGVDPSAAMVEASRRRVGDGVTAIVRAVGERLPFCDAAFSGCRIERVLMHVDDPSVVLDDALRCVESGGLVTVFEPDWTSLVVKSSVLPERASWLSSVRHPDIGARLWDLLENHGCVVLDRVEELSVWRSLAVLEHVADFPSSAERAAVAGRIGDRDAKRWVDDQRRRDAAGAFYATMPKIQMIARKQ